MREGDHAPAVIVTRSPEAHDLRGATLSRLTGLIFLSTLTPALKVS